MSIHYETDNWTFVPAKWFQKWTAAGKRRPDLIVIHAMQYYERDNTAEVIAHDFATRGADNKASAHLCIDNNSIIQCVHDNDVAYAAPNANRNGIQIELAGYSEQTREQWLDPYSIAMLELATDATAQYCLKYSIPMVKLEPDHLRTGLRGICGHRDVTKAFNNPTAHMDPGPNFPWDYFMRKVQEHYAKRLAQ